MELVTAVNLLNVVILKHMLTLKLKRLKMFVKLEILDLLQLQLV